MPWAFLIFAVLLTGILLVIGRNNRKRRLRPKPVPFQQLWCDENKKSSNGTQAVVIGGCGCLGKELIRQLLAEGIYTVHCLDLFIPSVSKRISGVASYVQADIANYSDVSRALQGMEVVFHVAAIIPVNIFATPEAMERVNVTGTKNVVKAFKECGVKRLIYTSSFSVVMSRDKRKNVLNMDESFSLSKDPLHPYVKTKGLAEMAVREAHGDEQKTCSLRLGGLVGGMGNSGMENLMKDPPILLGDGTALMSWTTVTSAAHVHILAERYLALGHVSSNVFNVISVNTTHGNLFDSFAHQNGSKPPRSIPMWLCKVLGLFNEGVFWLTGLIPLDPGLCYNYLVFISTCTGSTKLTEEVLGWVERRSLHEIVASLVKEYNSHRE